MDGTNPAQTGWKSDSLVPYSPYRMRLFKHEVTMEHPPRVPYPAVRKLPRRRRRAALGPEKGKLVGIVPDLLIHSHAGGVAPRQAVVEQNRTAAR